MPHVSANINNNIKLLRYYQAFFYLILFDMENYLPT